MKRDPSNGSSGGSDDDRKRIGEEIALRLRRRGVQLTGQEESEELADLEEAVEEFERAVERSGGDLMVDEPVTGDRPIAPDQPDFVLPKRKGTEPVASFITRIQEATARAERKRDAT